MENNTINAVKIYSLIKGACFVKDIPSLRTYAGLGYHIFVNDDNGYFQTLAIQLMSTCYIRYIALNGNESDTLVVNFSDIHEKYEKDFVLANVNPRFILNCRNSIYGDLDKAVKNKLDDIINHFVKIPCVSKYFYDHSELKTELVNEFIYKKEELIDLLKLNKEYSIMFILHMCEFYNPYSYEDQTQCLNTFTVEKQKEYLDILYTRIESMLKSSDINSISAVALTIVLNIVYRYGNKEISEKSFNILEKIVRYYCIGKKQDDITLDPNTNIKLNFDLLIVIGEMAKQDNKDNRKVVAQINDKIKKLSKKIR